MIKKQIRMFLMIFCLLFTSASAVFWLTPVSTEAADTGDAKTGLVKEKGKYYYYVINKNGQSEKVTNKWKTVKVTKKGKIYSYRYYFGKNGAAYSGSVKLGVKTPAIKKIGTKYYGFDTNARMLKGIYVINDKFYVFNSKTGVYDSAKSSKLRKAYGYEKKAATLKKLLGKPKKTEKLTGCYGNGKEYMLYYQNFVLSTGETSKGVEIIFGVLPY